MKITAKILLFFIYPIGVLSIGYLFITLIALAGKWQYGGTGDILEWIKLPVVYGTIIISVAVLVFAKKTAKRWYRLVAE